ncbi:MAG: NUDIX hydrolase [Kiritimatiellae bacterium]|nr:NUDIX hydrolase [Kiritimatiellia bacterium]
MHERTLATQTIYDGRVVRLEVTEVELADGRRSVREIVRHAPAVAVLPRLPDGDFLLVRQYRKAVEAEVIELCAGLCEPGEAPEAAARRELLEETGRTARLLRHLGRVLASPGYTDEWIDLFFAECDGSSTEADWDADEHLELVRFRPEELRRALRDNVIRDGKTLAAWALAELKGWLDAGGL